MHIETIRTPGLGDSTYLFSHEGVAVVVDPQRDIDRFIAALGDTPVRMVLETHLHNDYVSGAREIARRTGAELVVPAGAAPVYRHTPAFHMEDLDAGAFAIRPIHTPGHTPEHVSYLVLIDGRPFAVFSGGSLLVGSAGRPDLLGLERADSLARLQYLSVHRLAALPDAVELLPTHGEGSFCTVSIAGKTTSTIGEEKRLNPVLRYPGADAFVEGQLAFLQPYPAYYRYMGPANLFGYPEMPRESLPELETAALASMKGVELVDIRPIADFAAGHVPGATGIEMGDQVGVWAGWLLAHDARVVLVANRGQDVAEAAAQFRRIGMDDLAGVFYEMDGWKAKGLPVRSHRVVDVEQFVKALHDGIANVLDVRAPNEYETGSIEGAVWSYLPDLAKQVPEGLNVDEPVWVACASGYRSNAAVRFLEEAGYEPVVLAGAGVPEVLEALRGRGPVRT